MSEENPFNNLPATQNQEQSLVNVEQQRAIAEVQSAMIIAKRFPRDQRAAMDRILTACTRPTLAEKAVYSYARGGTDISGPSIKLAEAIAQNWGNLQFGIRELSQANGESTVESYAWDIESNTRQVKTFQVPHTRYSKAKGNVKLSDPRDIYELTANQGARRLRACILGIVPGDVVDAAVKQCESTLKTSIKITPELLQSLLEKFAEFRITKAMIETRIQRRFDAITPALVAQLGKIYNSLKDGMGSVGDWFDILAGHDSEPGADDIDEKFINTFNGAVRAENVAFAMMDQFMEEVGKKHKLPIEAVKEGAIKDQAKFVAAFKKFLAKQNKSEKPDFKPQTDQLPDAGKLIEKPPILCPATKSGVFPDECEKCDESKNPDGICQGYQDWKFDQNQK